MSKINKPRLGRGLSSLISVDIPDEPEAGPSLPSEVPSALADPIAPPPAELPITQRIVEVPIGEIRSNPHQPRKEFDEASLQELSASLKTNGLIQPIVVRQTSTGFELIAGERRLRAAKLAGLKTLSVIVKEADGLTQAQWALVENIQRENLNPIDRAQSYKTLLDQLGLSHAELAQRLGEDRSTISNHLRLLELAAPVQELLRSTSLSLGHAKVLAGVPDVLEQNRLANLVVQQGLSVRNLEKLVQGGPSVAATPKTAGPSAHIRKLEKSISGQLGMRVNVKAAKQSGKGKLVINYSSLDQFDELMAKLGVRTTEED